MGQSLGDHRQPFRLSGSWPTYGTHITSALFPRRVLEILPGSVCQLYHRCPKKAEGCRLGTEQMEGGTQTPPPPTPVRGGVCSEPPPLLLAPSKPPKTFQMVTTTGGAPNKVERNLSL